MGQFQGPGLPGAGMRTRTIQRAAWLLIAASVASVAAADHSTGDEPTSMARAPKGYETRRIEGWTVIVSKPFLQAQPELSGKTLELLRFQLYQITRVVPPEALAKLQTIRIWVEEAEPHTPCMAYHPDPGWLREHDMTTDKARCVELANARNFLSWTLEQPWMLLHELAHGYHHQFLEGGFQNPQIKAAYDRAMKAGIYNKVTRYRGEEEKSYAATNPMEYFAEATEAYFGTNDMFPFVRIELKRHDPALYDVVETAWGVKSGLAKGSSGKKDRAPGRSGGRSRR